MKNEVTYQPKKDTDFILTDCEEIRVFDVYTKYSVVYVNNLNGIKTSKQFIVNNVEVLKTVMSSDEISELSNFIFEQ